MPQGFELLTTFFSRPACQRATEPLRKGTEIAIIVDGQAACLRRTKEGMAVEKSASENPDMTFTLSSSVLKTLVDHPTEDIGEIGIGIVKAITHAEPEQRMGVKVHIGPLDLFLHGYLGVLPLGGASLMKFLASKGLTGISKIKEGIARFRE